MQTIESEVPYPVQNIWMFTNWFAELNLFSFATFPPVSAWFLSIFTPLPFFLCFFLYFRRPLAIENYTCECPMAASGDSLGPNIQQPFMAQTHTKGFGKYMATVLFSGSYTCVIWGLCKLTWQVNLTSHNLSSDLKRGKRARRKSTCQVYLSSWLVCQVELDTASGICDLQKKLQASAGFFRVAMASEKVFARFFGPFFAFCRLSKKRVFEWTRWKIWLSCTSFSQYKQSRSDTGSTQKIGINKERESERFSHQRRRTSQWNCWS